MARARNIKPGIRTNDDLAELPPLTRLTFIYLWMSADFNGNMLYKPKRLQAENIPYDNVDIEDIVSELEQSGFVKRYDENGSRYLSICNFTKHQNPHKNEVLRGTDIPTIEEVEARKQEQEKKQEEHKDNGDHDPDGSKTEQGRDENGSNPPDSGFLIPDSGSPQNPCASGDAPPAENAPAQAELYSEDFNRFWDAYPSKKGKKPAAQKFKAVRKQNPSPEFLDRLIEDVECRARGHEWTKNNGQFIPMASTYLNQERWNDPAPNVSQLQSRHNGFEDRDYSQGLIEGVSDDAANF